MAEANSQDTNELIVTFKRGISEDIARAAVKAAGGTVRRRMRTDFPQDIVLLVRAPGKVSELESKMKAMPSVVATEINQGGFGAR
jgi:hypothetical protein